VRPQGSQEGRRATVINLETDSPHLVYEVAHGREHQDQLVAVPRARAQLRAALDEQQPRVAGV